MGVREPTSRYQLGPTYKRTDVGVIPHEWSVRSVGDLFRLVNGCAFKPEDWKDSGTPIIRIQNINDPAASFNYSQLPPAQRNRVEQGDLLFAWSGTIGSSFGARIWRGPSGVLNQHIFKVHVDELQVCLSFSLLVFARVEADIAKQAHGFKASFVHVKKADLIKIRLPVPPLKEQHVIAEVLSDADALIESLEQLLAKKRQIKQGAMQELLTGKRRLSGFVGNWNRTPLAKLATIQRGASPRPIDSPIWFDNNSAVGWVRISDVTQSDVYLTQTTQRLSAEGILRSRPVPNGSLIMSICATVGRPVITAINVCIHDGFVVFGQLRIDQKFLYFMLASIEPDWSSSGQTGSQMNLNTRLIGATEVNVPPTFEEQTAIATILSDMDTELAALETQLSKARQLKQGMMQVLLTGQIRLPLNTTA